MYNNSVNKQYNILFLQTVNNIAVFLKIIFNKNFQSNISFLKIIWIYLVW